MGWFGSVILQSRTKERNGFVALAFFKMKPLLSSEFILHLGKGQLSLSEQGS